jgi:hypothetical protein
MLVFTADASVEERVPHPLRFSKDAVFEFDLAF